jgi:hypothetical protein
MRGMASEGLSHCLAPFFPAGSTARLPACPPLAHRRSRSPGAVNSALLLLPSFRWRTGSWLYAAIWPVHLERLGAAPTLAWAVRWPSRRVAGVEVGA